MLKDVFKDQIAEVTSSAAGRAFPELAESLPDSFLLSKERIGEKLEIPRRPEWGNYALPLFEPAKALGKNPVEFNRALTAAQNEIIGENPALSHLGFSAEGGFNNARIALADLARAALAGVHRDGSAYGSSDVGRGGNVVIDFSSPNIAKPFGIGHLRTTAIGHSLYRIFNKLGYNSIGVNHLGDWGTQFGKLIVAHRLWGTGGEFGQDPVLRLLDLYVKFHKAEEEDPSLSEAAREAFKALEEGHQEEAELWKEIKDFSLEAFKATYRRLGIHFDYYTGESFYNDKIDGAIERLEKAGLTTVSQGALIVDLEKYDLPPCILRKADGATLYATRDIAGVLYRWEEFRFDRCLYVVATAQRDHFKQVFKVIELLEEAEDVPSSERISHRLVHVEFGWIKLMDKMMSTRRGNIIFLDDVLDRAVALARERILEKNPDLEEIDGTARQIGIGAVLFADMSTRRMKDVNFEWNEVLNFEGETGPYLQYTHARLSSLVRHYGREISERIDYSLLDRPEEYRVIDQLYKFPAAVYEAAETYEPYVIVSYLLELAAAFNKVYQRKGKDGRIDKIISDDVKLTEARMSLVGGVRVVLKEGLHLLGIESPEAM